MKAVSKKNVDESVVADFGREWARFDQSGVRSGELEEQFARYFAVFPWTHIPENAVGFDLGCGSGRWAAFVAPKVGQLHCIDASSSALEVAKRKLSGHSNCVFHQASVHDIPIDRASLDFGYSLGVLHHVPDTLEGLKSCAGLLKTGAPFLVYLYYAFDNRPLWFRGLWKISDLIRRGTSALPSGMKARVCEVMAVLVYWPLARTAAFGERLGLRVDGWPLAAYRDMSFYTMRTDSLDRFGTRLEQRFTRSQIESMLIEAGFRDVRFSTGQPFWCAVGFRS